MKRILDRVFRLLEVSPMGKSNTSVAAIVAITSTQFVELSALGLSYSKKDRASGEGRGELITWCVEHGVNTANFHKTIDKRKVMVSKRSLSLEQVKLFKENTLVHRLSDAAQELYAMGGVKAAGRVAPNNEGNTHNAGGDAFNYKYYDRLLNKVLDDLQKGIEGRKIKAARIAEGGSGNRTLVAAIGEENAKFFLRTYKDEGINLPEGHDVEGLQKLLKELMKYVGGTIPVIKD